MNDEFIQSLKSRGFWRFNFQPLAPSPSGPLSLNRCRELVRDNGVRLRGWDYPHFPERSGDDTGLELMDSFVQGWIDWGDHREFWRMYTSSQFLHYRAIHEDWPERELSWGAPLSTSRTWDISRKRLGVTSNLWLLTEVSEVLSRLVTSGGLYQRGVRLSIELHSGEGDRSLHADEPGRMPFLHDRSTQATTITFIEELDSVLAMEPKLLAAQMARHIFERFDWSPSSEQLESDISRLYAMR